MAQKKRNGSAITVSASLKSKDGKETKLPFYFGDAGAKVERYLNGSMGLPVLGVTDLWQISPEHDLQTAVWLLDKPVNVSAGEWLIVSLGNAAVSSARVSVTPFAADEPLKSGAKNFKDKLLETYLLGTHWNPDVVADMRKVHPHARVLAFVGESHLAPEHLPLLVRKALPGERVLTVLQNVDSLYWQLAEGDAIPQPVAVSDDVLCVFNASPLEKYETYREYLERWRG